MVSTLFFLTSPSEIAELTLVDAGEVNLLHYVLYNEQGFKSGSINIVKKLGTQKDFILFKSRSQVLSKWKEISDEEFMKIKELIAVHPVEKN